MDPTPAPRVLPFLTSQRLPRDVLQCLLAFWKSRLQAIALLNPVYSKEKDNVALKPSSLSPSGRTRITTNEQDGALVADSKGSNRGAVSPVCDAQEAQNSHVQKSQTQKSQTHVKEVHILVRVT